MAACAGKPPHGIQNHIVKSIITNKTAVELTAAVSFAQVTNVICLKSCNFSKSAKEQLTAMFFVAICRLAACM